MLVGRLAGGYAIYAGSLHGFSNSLFTNLPISHSYGFIMTADLDSLNSISSTCLSSMTAISTTYTTYTLYSAATFTYAISPTDLGVFFAITSPPDYFY